MDDVPDLDQVVEYKCNTCEKRYDDRNDALDCYYRHGMAAAITRVVTGDFGDIYE